MQALINASAATYAVLEASHTPQADEAAEGFWALRRAPQQLEEELAATRVRLAAYGDRYRAQLAADQAQLGAELLQLKVRSAVPCSVLCHALQHQVQCTAWLAD